MGEIKERQIIQYKNKSNKDETDESIALNYQQQIDALQAELDAHKSDLITRDDTISEIQRSFTMKGDEMQKYKLDISTQASKEATKYKNALKKETTCRNETNMNNKSPHYNLN